MNSNWHLFFLDRPDEVMPVCTFLAVGPCNGNRPGGLHAEHLEVLEDVQRSLVSGLDLTRGVADLFDGHQVLMECGCTIGLAGCDPATAAAPFN